MKQLNSWGYYKCKILCRTFELHRLKEAGDFFQNKVKDLNIASELLLLLIW